mgnify:FL=1
MAKGDVMIKLPTIIIDTREQKPYTFKGYKVVRKVLKAGDYSMSNRQALVLIERKSLADLYGTLTRKTNFERFIKELEKLKFAKYPFLMLDCSPSHVHTGFSYSMANGGAVLDKLMRICCMYGVQVIFAGNREMSERLVLSIFNAVITIEP